MDYSYDTTVTTSSASDGLLASMFLVIFLVYIAVLLVMLVANWKLYIKAGKPGWASIVPIYNYIVMLQMVGRPVWWILLAFVPFVNIVFAFIVVNDLSKSFGKEIGWTLGMIFLPVIFYPILAFGSAKYVGPGASLKTPSAPVAPAAPAV